jgi:hypothetical protein
VTTRTGARPFGSYADGFAAGAAARVPHDLFAPLPVPWRTVRAEDVVMGDDGELYSVERSGWIGASGPDGRPTTWGLTLVCGAWRDTIPGGPDDLAHVLTRVGTVDAVTVTREALGARLLATRSVDGVPVEPDLMWKGDRGR